MRQGGNDVSVEKPSRLFLGDHAPQMGYRLQFQ